MKRELFWVGLSLGAVYLFSRFAGNVFSRVQFGFKGLTWYGFSGTANAFCLVATIQIINQNKFGFPKQSFQGAITHRQRKIATILSNDISDIKAQGTTDLKYLIPIDFETLRAILSEYGVIKQGFRLSDIRIVGNLLLHDSNGGVLYSYALDQYVTITIDKIW